MNSSSSSKAIFSREITLGYNHVYQDGQISVTALMEELEETASEHCRLIGQDIFSLLHNNTAWVLKGGALEMDSYPGYAMTVRIETWISSMERYRGYREYSIRDENGRVLGSCSTLWVFMDLVERTLIPIPEVFHREWESDSYRPIDTLFCKKDYSPLVSGHLNVFDLRRRDIDSNSHVHNIRYLEWICESMPSEVYESCQISQMEVLYRKEARYENKVQIRTERQKDGSFRHDITDRERGTLLMSAVSRWAEKSVLYNAC